MLELRDYQQSTHDKTIQELKTNNKVLVQLPTGAGKSVNIGYLANNLPGRTIILCHRIEILNQNSEWIEDIGVLTASVKKVQGLRECKNVISMAQTLVARFKKYSSDYLGEFDNVIIDEVHYEIFKKVYDQIDYKKLIAFTATPILNKTETKTIDGIEYTRKKTFSSEYDVLIQGVSEKELIELGFLTQDFNIQLTPDNFDKLKDSKSNPDGYTSKSLTEVFGSKASVEKVYESYLKFGKGKKTIIFTPTTAANLEVGNYFKEKDINAEIFDSVNDSKYSRKEIVEWFNNTDDAVLINTNVFTTGFDSRDVECVIINRATKSLSLFLQIIGRGSRILNQEQIKAGKVKDKFVVVDLGLNLSTHGKWSDSRNWNKYFTDNPWKQKQVMDLMQLWECTSCGFFNEQGTFFNQELERIECNECHKPKPPRNNKKFIKGKFIILEKPITPNATKIIEYVKRVGGDGNMALKLVRKQIIDLFIFYTDKEDFIARYTKYQNRVGSLYRPVYFLILKDKELTTKRRKLATELSKLWEKVCNQYETSPSDFS